VILVLALGIVAQCACKVWPDSESVGCLHRCQLQGEVDNTWWVLVKQTFKFGASCGMAAEGKDF
jgi:hypothetical protein